MSTDMKNINPSENFDKTLKIIKKKKIKKLPVVQGNDLVGIITVTDIAYSRPSVRKFLDDNQIMLH